MLYKLWLQIKASRSSRKFVGDASKMEHFKEKLLQGCDYLVKRVVEDVRFLDLEGSLSRGNHKSAKWNEGHLSKAIIK